MISMLVTLIVLLLVLYLVFYLINQIPFPPAWQPLRTVLVVIACLIVILWFAQMYGLLA